MVSLARRTFGGASGTRALAALIAVGVTGWTGFYVGVASGALGRLLGIETAVIGLGLAGFIWIIYRTGRDVWDALVALTGLAAIAVAVLVFTGVPDLGSSPPATGVRLGPVAAGAGAIVSYAAIFAVRSADFTWDVRRERDVVRAVMVMVVTLLLFAGLGAGMFVRAGAWDLADLANRTRYSEAAVILLAVSAVAPSVSALHSGGLALELLTRRPAGTGAGAVALVGGVLGAWRFDLLLLPFLEVLGIIVPPILATMLVKRSGQPGGHAWISWAAGSVGAAVATLLGWPGPVVIGLVVAAAVMRSLASTTLESDEGPHR